MLVNDVELETDLGRFLILQISSQPRMMSLLVYFPSACCVWHDQSADLQEGRKFINILQTVEGVAEQVIRIFY